MSIVPSILIPLSEVDIVCREDFYDESTYPSSSELDFFTKVYHSFMATEKVVATFERYYEQGNSEMLSAIHRVLLELERLVVECLFSFHPSTIHGKSLYDRAVELYSKMLKRIQPVRTIFVANRFLMAAKI